MLTWPWDPPRARLALDNLNMQSWGHLANDRTALKATEDVELCTVGSPTPGSACRAGHQDEQKCSGVGMQPRSTALGPLPTPAVRTSTG